MYGEASLFVFLSLDEGFGMPCLEALHFGTPILASDIPVFREILRDQAWYADPHSVDAAAAAIAGALESVERQGRPPRKRPEELGYAWAVSVQRLRAAAVAAMGLLPGGRMPGT